MLIIHKGDKIKIMEGFNEKDVRLFYRFLNHRFLTELRFLKKGHFPVFKIVKSENEFVKVCKQWNGKRNVYAGLRDRRKGLKRPANFSDIIGIQTIAIDIDPIRETGIPSTEEELKRAIEISEIIQDWFKENGFLPPVRAMTGNGVCMYFSIPFYEVNDENRFDITGKLDFFEKRISEIFRKDLKRLNCKIDPMYDLPRIVKVIGTLSVKGENTSERPWRLSYFIDEPKRMEDEKLLKAILEENI